jgi:hypothetical protein
MMQGMQEQLDSIQQLGRDQMSILRELNQHNLSLPHLFAIVPEVKRHKLDKHASRVAKAMNFVLRVTEMTQAAIWSKSRLIFICP